MFKRKAMTNRRLGKLNIPVDDINEFDSTAKRALGKCIVVRAEVLFSSNSVEYIVISDHFREVPFGEMIPSYDIIVNNGFIEFKEKDSI